MKAYVLALLVLPGLALAQACEVAALVGNASSAGAALQVGSPVAAGTELQTGPDSRLRLRCRDGSSLVMAANSRLRIEAFEMQSDGKRAEAEAGDYPSLSWRKDPSPTPPHKGEGLIVPLPP